MLIIPAIDLQDGCVVRLVQGRLNKKVYSRDPLKTAKHWVKQGAKLLHVVDLDGAMTGEAKNSGYLKDIVKEAGVPVEFGGGVRSIKIIKELLGLGVYRVILGTKAVQDREFLQKSLQKFSGKIIVSIDTQGTKILTQGWKKQAVGGDLLEFAKELKKMGLQQIIYTDTTKDGTLKGPNVAEIKKLLKNTGLAIIASGGISSLEDLKKLKNLQKYGLSGVIIGKALYEGKFTLTEALRVG